MKVLVINSGSSSIKYTLFHFPEGIVKAKGIVERIGLKDSCLIHSIPRRKRLERKIRCPDHTSGIRILLDILTDSVYGVLKNLEEIDAVGHRVVHGGEDISDSTLITDEVINVIEKHIELAPLHNPPNLLGIKACKKFLPHKPQVAVFDTAYYHTLPERSYIYGIPFEYYQKYKIRRYGFHGTSHRYVTYRTAELLKKPLERLKIITCHLGNGCSITATLFGKAVDTSMGFTPLEGLLMGTRCGDIDPAAVFFLMEKEGLTPAQINTILNKKSGLLGLSGLSNDMRDITRAMKKGNPRARLAYEVFLHRTLKYIGAYIMEMNGVDAIVFTAGIGENHKMLREDICKHLEWAAVRIDKKLNESPEKEKIISTKNSRVKILVIPTNEELLIAQDTVKIVS